MAISLGISPKSGPLHPHKPVQVGRESERNHQDCSRKSVAAHHHPLVLEPYERGNPDLQKLASQVGRSLQRLKAHKYFTYRVEAGGQLGWERKEDLIAQEAQQDGWYLLHTNEPTDRCTGEQVLAHYEGLLDVEEAFCELKSYLEVRPEIQEAGKLLRPPANEQFENR